MRALLLICGLTGLFFGWNLPNHYPPWTAFHSELVAALGASLLFLGLLWPQPASVGGDPLQAASRVALPLPFAARMWLLAGLVPVVQFLAGGLAFRGDALLGLLYGLGVAMSLYAGSLWAAQEGGARVVKLVCATIVFGGLAASGLALAQWQGLGAGGWWAMELIASRPYGNLAQPNHFGLLMLMSLIATTALFETRDIKHRASYYLAVAMFGAALLISQSRASVVALVAVVALWCLTRHRAPTRLRIVEVVAMAAAGTLFYFGLESIEQALYLAAAAGPRQMLQIGPRESIWLLFVAAIKQHPWLGYGFGQGVMALAEVAAQGQPARNSIYAHNVVLDLMTWFGVPLAIAMTAALGKWFLGWLRTGGAPEEAARRHWVAAIWLALLVQSLLEFPFAHSYFLLPAALLAGAITGVPLTVRATTAPSPGYRASLTAMALAAITIGLLAAVARDYFWLEGDFRANRFERANFSHRPEHESLTHPIVLDQLAALNATAHFNIRAGMPAEQIASLHTVARRFHILPIRMDYARALALNGRLDEANHELQILHGLYPDVVFKQIDAQWQDWLRENRLVNLPAN